MIRRAVQWPATRVAWLCRTPLIHFSDVVQRNLASRAAFSSHGARHAECLPIATGQSLRFMSSRSDPEIKNLDTRAEDLTADGTNSKPPSEEKSAPSGFQNISDVDELRRSLEETTIKLNVCEKLQQETHDKLLRALAENANSRLRHQKELEQCRDYAITKFAQAVLDVADNLELALSHGTTNSETGGTSKASIIQGIELTQTVLANTLRNFGIESFDALGEQFCPKLHEALFEVEAADKGTVVQVVKRGYRIKNRILRAAQVGTAK